MMHTPNAERCMAVVMHHDRITSWTLCRFRRKHTVNVLTAPQSRWDKNFVPQPMTAHVCSLHLRRLKLGHRLDVHDGGWRGHFKNEPTDIPVVIAPEETP